MDEVTNKMSLEMTYLWVKMTYVREFKYSWASTKKWSKNLKRWNKSSGNRKQEKTQEKEDKARLEITNYPNL